MLIGIISKISNMQSPAQNWILRNSATLLIISTQQHRAVLYNNNWRSLVGPYIYSDDSPEPLANVDGIPPFLVFEATLVWAATKFTMLCLWCRMPSLSHTTRSAVRGTTTHVCTVLTCVTTVSTCMGSDAEHYANSPLYELWNNHENKR